MAHKLKVQELRNLTEEELSEKRDQLKKQLMEYRFQAKTGKLEQQNLLSQVRHDIARIMTVLTEKKAEAIK